MNLYLIRHADAASVSSSSEDASRPLDRYAPAPYAELATFEDYIVFRGSVREVVAEGRFDRNWKLPPDAAAKIAATGIVTVR